jgi:hypothetical protein
MSSWKLPPRRVGKMILSEPCQNSVLYAPERGKVRKRFRVQQPTPRLRKIAGVLKWYGQWRDADGQKRGKILGPKSMTESQAKAALEAIVHPINSGSRQPAKPAYTFGRYVEEVYIPFKRRRWKESSTAQTAVQQIGHHLVPELADLLLPTIEREDLQALARLRDCRKALSGISAGLSIRFSSLPCRTGSFRRIPPRSSLCRSTASLANRGVFSQSSSSSCTWPPWDFENALQRGWQQSRGLGRENSWLGDGPT